MTDIWKIGQETNAADFYEKSKNIGFIKSEIIAANIIAKVCDKMSENYEEILADQNEYLIDLNEELAEIENLQKELNAQIKAQEEERSSILEKAEDEELSEEDKTRLNEINNTIDQLTNDTNTKIAGINTDIDNKSKEADKNISKKSIAMDYGNTAIEKGTPLANTQDKRRSFWRRLSGSWDKSATREAGKLAVDAGNNLIEQVESSVEIEKEIKLKAQNKKV